MRKFSSINLRFDTTGSGQISSSKRQHVLSIRAIRFLNPKKDGVESASFPSGEAFDRQGEVIMPVMRSADAIEGAAAFAEKRAPVWRGE